MERAASAPLTFDEARTSPHLRKAPLTRNCAQSPMIRGSPISSSQLEPKPKPCAGYIVVFLKTRRVRRHLIRFVHSHRAATHDSVHRSFRRLRVTRVRACLFKFPGVSQNATT